MGATNTTNKYFTTRQLIESAVEKSCTKTTGVTALALIHDFTDMHILDAYKVLDSMESDGEIKYSNGLIFKA